MQFIENEIDTIGRQLGVSKLNLIPTNTTSCSYKALLTTALLSVDLVSYL